MKSALLMVMLAGASAAALAEDVYVQPHITRDGTFVQGYMKTAPNSTRLDNYSTQGNFNPYTGQAGTKPAYPEPVFRAPALSPSTGYKAYEVKPLKAPKF